MGRVEGLATKGGGGPQQREVNARLNAKEAQDRGSRWRNEVVENGDVESAVSVVFPLEKRGEKRLRKSPLADDVKRAADFQVEEAEGLDRN